MHRPPSLDIFTYDLPCNACMSHFKFKMANGQRPDLDSATMVAFEHAVLKPCPFIVRHSFGPSRAALRCAHGSPESEQDLSISVHVRDQKPQEQVKEVLQAS